MKLWLQTALALAAVWAVAAGLIHWLHASKPTAASVHAYLARTDVSKLQGRDRDRAIGQVEDQMNDVSFDERGKIERSGDLRQFFVALTPAEQEHFLDATLPAGFKQIMDAFNKMTPERRKEFVNHALEDMKKREGQEPPPNAMDPKLNEKFIDQGLKSFYKDASPDTKLDLAPLIEQMQRNLQLGAQG